MPVKNKTILALDTETSATDPISPHTCEYLCYSMSSGKVSKCGFHELPSLPEDSFIIAHNGKYDKVVLSRAGLNVNIDWDTLIAEYLLNIDKPRGLEKTYERYTGTSKEGIVDIYNNASGKNIKNLPEKWYEQVPNETIEEYAKADTEATLEIYRRQVERFKEYPELYKWFMEVEMPLVNIISDMELKGVRLDRGGLLKIKDTCVSKLHSVTDRLKFICDDIDEDNPINYNSTKQIGELIKKFKLKVTNKTKTGAVSTDTKALSKLAKQHAFPKLLLEYRELNKILNTYVLPLLSKADSEGRIHCNFNQSATVTRRWSSNNPNLQNIAPIVRGCFVPSEGNHFLIADYSQVELRILAHFSQDKALLKAFSGGDLDIHKYTASLMFDTPIDKVTDEQRKIGKTLNFSVVYGKSAFGFAEDWNCSIVEAQGFIDRWFNTYAGVKDYFNQVERKIMHSKGWLETVCGLPLYVGDPMTNNKWEYQHVVRCSRNYPIQGSSQDVIKRAIVNIYSKIGEVPVLQVHDELVFDLHPSVDHAIIIGEMEKAVDLSVPLKVDYKISDKWEK